MPVQNSDVPSISSDKWIKLAHLHELQSVQTRGGCYKINPLTTLPQFTPGENYYSGSLVQKVEHEVPIETVDQYFQLLFTPEIMEVFVRNTNSFAQSTHEMHWNVLTVPEFKTFMSVCLYLGIVKYPSKMDAWSDNKFYGSNWVQ